MLPTATTPDGTPPASSLFSGLVTVPPGQLRPGGTFVLCGIDAILLPREISR
jgi:hypothetical protein